MTITLWHLFGGEEAPVFKKALAGFHKQYPWITVKPIVQPNTVNDTFDPNLINAIKGGNPPDVALPFGPDYVAQYCTSGLWQDLTPYMQRDNVDDLGLRARPRSATRTSTASSARCRR